MKVNRFSSMITKPMVQGPITISIVVFVTLEGRFLLKSQGWLPLSLSKEKSPLCQIKIPFSTLVLHNLPRVVPWISLLKRSLKSLRVKLFAIKLAGSSRPLSIVLFTVQREMGILVFVGTAHSGLLV